MDSDSDFYGDDETSSALQDEVHAFDVKRWWADHRRFGRSPTQVREMAPNVPKEQHNAYEGLKCARQLSETVEEFLSRLPPETTDISEQIQWIYIANPFVIRRNASFSRQSEAEGPEDPRSRTEEFKEGGMERVHIFDSFLENSRKSPKSDVAIAREVNKERTGAERDILNLAYMLRVRVGKWMLFPDPKFVNEAWSVVANATANNELGIAAKVAPRTPTDPASHRLICIYTRDFKDKDDILRVLLRMKELGLVNPSARPIYYKCDAWSYLGMDRQNKWKFKMSMYSSKEIFDYATLGAGDGK